MKMKRVMTVLAVSALCVLILFGALFSSFGHSHVGMTHACDCILCHVLSVGKRLLDAACLVFLVALAICALRITRAQAAAHTTACLAAVTPVLLADQMND